METPDLDESALIFVAAPSIGPIEGEICTQLLCTDTDHPHVLHIDFIKSPRERTTYWAEDAPTRLSALGILNIETYTRSTATETTPEPAHQLDVTVETVSSPDNLTQLGIGITKCLDQWTDGDEEIRVCFHSVSAMIHYTSVSAVFQFLNVLRTQLAKRGATGHVHIDPNAHDDRVITQLKPLFDALVEVELDGSVDVTAC